MSLCLKVITFNTWGGKEFNRQRWPLIGKGLAQIFADIVGLQEVFLTDQAMALQKISSMPEISYEGNQSGLMVLSRFPLKEGSVHRYLTKSPTESYFRYCQMNQIRLTLSHSILFVVTHLSWRPEEEGVRQDQVRELLRIIERYPEKLTCILVGDFNATPDSSEMIFLKEVGFVDTFDFLYPGQPGFTWSRQNPYTISSHPELPPRRIDQILIRVCPPEVAHWTIESSKIVFNEPSPEGMYPSDHFGVLTTLRVEE